MHDNITTPLHAVFYSGYICFATWIAWMVVRRVSDGHRGVDAAPVGYGVVGPFALMRPRQFIADEGPGNSARIVGRACSNCAYMRKVWLMRNIVSIVPKLGYIVLRGTKAEAPG